MAYLIAADIGGTSSRFGLFESGEHLSLEKAVILNTQEASSFSDLLGQVERSPIGEQLRKVPLISIAAAGPVKEGRYCFPPFVGWNIDVEETRIELGLGQITIINDFLGQAYGCCSEIGGAAKMALPGKRVPGATIGVIGAGTDLGKAILFPLPGGAYYAAPSEGGHSNAALQGDREFGLYEFAKGKGVPGYITWGDLVSGRGIGFIHEYLTGEKLTPAEVAASFSTNLETLEWVARFYGRAVRNFALEIWALGGVYLAGGVVARNPILVEHPAFVREFRSPRAYKEAFAEIPVYIVTNEANGLWGAAIYGRQVLEAAGRN